MTIKNPKPKAKKKVTTKTLSNSVSPKSLLALIGKDPEAVRNGKWARLPFTNVVLEIKIRAKSDPVYLLEHSKLIEEYSDLSTETPEGRERLVEYLKKDTVRRLADWKGFTDSAGKEVEFSYEVGDEFMLNPAFEDLTDAIFTKVTDDTLFKFNQEQTSEKN